MGLNLLIQNNLFISFESFNILTFINLNFFIRDILFIVVAKLGNGFFINLSGEKLNLKWLLYKYFLRLIIIKYFRRTI